MAVYTGAVSNPNIAFLIDTIRKSAIWWSDIAALVSCDYDGTTMSVDFGSETLSAGDQTILAGLITACSGVDRDLSTASDRIWQDYQRRKNTAASASFQNPFDFETRFCSSLNSADKNGSGLPEFRWAAIGSGTLVRSADYLSKFATTIYSATGPNSGGTLVSGVLPCPSVGSEFGFSMRVMPRMISGRVITTHVGLHGSVTATPPAIGTDAIFVKFTTTSTEAKCQAFIYSASQSYTTSELIMAGNAFNHVGLGYVGGVLTLYVWSPTTFERRSASLTQALPTSLYSPCAVTSISDVSSLIMSIFSVAELRYYVTNAAV